MAQLKNTEISDTGFLQLPTGTTAERPSNPESGMVRFNTDTKNAEWYDAEYTAWFPTGFVPPVATGGTVSSITKNNIDFRVHAFTSVGNSSFTVTRSGEIEYVIIAGGGGGGSDDAGGGGAGGVLHGIFEIQPGDYTISVGAGGDRAGSGDTSGGRSGGDSAAFSLVAVGGGGGSHQASDTTAKNGGSGGGGGHAQDTDDPSQPSNGTAGQGFRGGVGFGRSDPWAAGGGGGAGEYGFDGKNGFTYSGRGGTGVYFEWAELAGYGEGGWFAGGGGGQYRDRVSPGGLGGGGNGGRGTQAGTDGQNNTGGGGGGGGNQNDNYLGGNGGSGIVLIRYRIS